MMLIYVLMICFKMCLESAVLGDALIFSNAHKQAGVSGSRVPSQYFLSLPVSAPLNHFLPLESFGECEM